ncbi:MAG TPA: protein-glutamate O-methyltransferase CheR, partial [Myxococcota bacterium]|nr:protein-glutamate O-methyltransferase CheR [Myxococcota bacterium]
MLEDDPAARSLTDAEFRLFTSLLRERCGLHFDDQTRYLVEKRVWRLIDEADGGSFAAFFHRLRHGPDAEETFSRVVDMLTTNETYFFREISQLLALVTEIIPGVLARRRGASRPVDVWSAGCASGEEPLSIVMLGLEAGLVPGRDFRVFASDLSRAALARARRGVYREASFRETDARMRRRYFVEKDGLTRISDDVKRHVDFVHLNLLDHSRARLLGPMDVILCRNVMIYFDVESRRRVVRSFHDRLRPGGHLLIGHSESLIKFTTDFELCHLRREL